MTFQKAMKHLMKGDRVYREGWRAGTYLENTRVASGIGGTRVAEHMIVCLYSDNRYRGAWVTKPEDLAAKDWRVERYVFLSAKPVS